LLQRFTDRELLYDNAISLWRQSLSDNQKQEQKWAHTVGGIAMKVEKKRFDELLGRMMQQRPEKTTAIKSQKTTATIIAPPKSMPDKQ
jgi:hypothetical protein